tara:strand:- start:907 stop:2181 length:1275 start_codon:yes stop_codon:yes gene_type:complete
MDTAEKKNAKSPLDVFLHGKQVGKLFSNIGGDLSFTYEMAYLKDPKAAKLSASLPLQGGAFDHPTTFAFFTGLLPDEYVRKRLARYLGLSEKNIFALLKEIGGECAGAVSLHQEGTSPRTQIEQTYRVLENKEAHDILSHLDKRPMLAGEEDIRISGAGAQNKLIISLIQGKIAIPTGNTPSTHIIKPAIKDIAHSVHNEFFCMKLAKAVGLPVPEVYIHWLENEPYYLIERYDRCLLKDGSIRRLHQEDFCQALHIPAEQKYENEGGPSLLQCFDFLDQRMASGVMAGRNKITLLEGVIFNFLIGNGDAHGKNFSLLYKEEAESLAPFYDLMSTVIYIGAFKAKMAMKLAGQSKFKDVVLHHFERLGESIGFRPDFVAKQVKSLTQKTMKSAILLRDKLNDDSRTASPIYDDILKTIEKHSQL